MTTDGPAASGLSPDEAFALVADETRLEILRTLSETDDPQSFSSLFEQSDYADSANFSYHLDKLAGHFVDRTPEGYALRQTGRRVVEAVVSGTMTDDPVVDRTPVDDQCPFCAAGIEVSYHQERVELYCTECPGLFRRADPVAASDAAFGTLGHIYLPPAGVDGRTPAELYHAAEAWSNLELLGISAGVCARCSGRIEQSVTVCADHDGSEGVCEHCDRRYAALFEAECRTCHYATSGLPIICLLGETALLSFVTDHGANPLRPETHEVAPGALANYEEEVRSLDPVEVALSFTIRDETLTLTVDGDASVVEARRADAAGHS